MHLSRFEIERIKCFGSLKFDFPNTGSDDGGWNVLLGANGTGKTTLLQAIAIALVGNVAGQSLLGGRRRTWLKQGTDEEPGYGTIRADVLVDRESAGNGKRSPRKTTHQVAIAVTGEKPVTIDGQPRSYEPQLLLRGDKKARERLGQGLYASGHDDRFCCGYGPFRRLGFGASDSSGSVLGDGPESNFRTLFDESETLGSCEDWLTDLYAQSLDRKLDAGNEAGHTLDVVQQVIASVFPGRVSITDVTTKGVVFHSMGGARVTERDLSDGYRCVLALIVDLLRRMHESGIDLTKASSTRGKSVAIDASGVVLIDEADAHLHPSWQRHLGSSLCKVFPRIQFIVSTHSPFVAQAATDGGLFVLRQNDEGEVRVDRPIDSVRGWRVDEILTSELFGLEGTRDLPTQELGRVDNHQAYLRVATERKPLKLVMVLS